MSLNKFLHKKINFLSQADEILKDSKQLAQYTPVDESEHKEVDRKHKLNSARVYFYQVPGVILNLLDNNSTRYLV